MNNDQWKMEFSPQGAKMDIDISAALANGKMVKANPVRLVIKDGELFFKLDKRNKHHFKKEYNAGKLLESKGIPVIENLGFGHGPQGNILITKEWKNSVTAEEYLKKNFPDKKFTTGLIDLTNLLFTQKIFHGDYHLGNILYRMEEGEFALVDLQAIRQTRWFDIFQSYRMKRIIMELRSKLERKDLEILLAKIGINNPGKFYLYSLGKEAKALFKQWHRRREQILNGYPKFTVKTPEALIVSPYKSLVDTYNESGTVMEVVAHWFLELAKIPHREVLGFRYTDSRIFYGPMGERIPPMEQALEYIQRLKFYGINTAQEDWRVDENNHIQYVALKSMAKKIG